MNQPNPSSDASVPSSQRFPHPASSHLGEHLSEPDQRRRRRRNLQRYSAVVATLFLGASQCDAPEPAPADPTAAAAAAAPATTAVIAPTTDATVATPAPIVVAEPERAGADAVPATTVAPTTTEPARVVIPGPDGTEAQGRCTQYEDLLMIHAPAIGWDVQRMSRLAWRESNCWDVIRSRTSDSGLLQINDITLSFLNEALGEYVDPFTLMDPVQNVRAAAALCTFWATNGSSCYQPWSTN